MSLEIAQLGQPILRQIAAEVPTDQIPGERFQAFLQAMRETLREQKGAGLAAPQVFVGLRVFLAGIHPPAAEGELPGVEVMVNPKITPVGSEIVNGWEGCLSFPELLVFVPRHKAVHVEFLNEQGAPRSCALQGFAARVVQHELDHLDGILTLDRASSTRDIIKASEIDAVLGKE